jgi:hypothetical protein
MVVAKQSDACLVALKGQGVACTDQTAGLPNFCEMHPLFVVAQMLPLFDTKSNFVSVVLQTADSTAVHLPGSCHR